MDKRDLVKAASVRPDTYPYNTPCIECGHEWWQHNGEICPRCKLCGKHPALHLPGQEGRKVSEPIYVDWSNNGQIIMWGWCHLTGITRFLVDISLLETNRDVPGFEA